MNNPKGSNKPKPHKIEKLKFFIPILIAYLYMSGRLYFDFYMERLGFAGANLEGILAPASYSLQAFSSALLPLFKVDYLNYLMKVFDASLIAALILALPIVAIRFKWIKKHAIRLSNLGKKEETDPSSDTRYEDFISKHWLIILLTIFPAIITFYFVLLVSITFIAAATILFFAVPALAGTTNADKYLENPVCEDLDWTDKSHNKKDIILGCEKIHITENGKPSIIKGDSIHTDSNFIYFSTNDALYRINKNREIVTKTVKQHRPKVNKPLTTESIPIKEKAAQ